MLLACQLSLFLGCSASEGQAGVFRGPNASYAERIADERETDRLRVVTVRDPLEASRGEVLVRIPLFFHEGEVGSAEQLRLRYAGDPSRAIQTQVDQLRLADDGGVARCELYALVDMAGGNQAVLDLYLADGGTPDRGRLMGVARHGDQIAFEGGSMTAVFYAQGNRQGRIRSLETKAGKLDFGFDGAGPSGVFQFQNLDCRASGQQTLGTDAPASSSFKWAVGPIFAKVVVTYELSELGGGVVYEYRIPKRGTGLQQSYYTYVEDTGREGAITIAKHRPLEGSAENIRWKQIKVPVGLRASIPYPHGHEGRALLDDSQGLALYPIPYVHDLVRDAWGEKGRFAVEARDQLRQPNGGSQAIRRVWGSVTYELAAAESGTDLRDVGLRVSNPPVAIIDEPGLGADALEAMLRQILLEQRPVGFGPKLAERVLQDRNVGAIGPHLGRAVGEDLQAEIERRARQARRAYEQKVAELGRPLREHEKGKAYGGLDPYHITFQDTVVGALAYLDDPRFSPEARDYAYVLGRATMEALGKKGPQGEVYIDTFHTALNMQVGPLLLGLIGGKAREDLQVVDFYRRLALGDGVFGLYGKGQRSYRSIQDQPSQSDLLYQELSDFFLRAAEIMAAEDLQTHPAAFARYMHCVSVDADLVQKEWSDEGRRAHANRRAHMYRAQAHDHRWEAWNASPLMCLLWPGRENEAGHTEAIYALERLRGKWINWPDYSYYFIALTLLSEDLQR